MSVAFLLLLHDPRRSHDPGRRELEDGLEGFVTLACEVVSSEHVQMFYDYLLLNM